VDFLLKGLLRISPEKDKHRILISPRKEACELTHFQHCSRCGHALRNVFIQHQCEDHFRRPSRCSFHLNSCCRKKPASLIRDKFFEIRSADCRSRRQIRFLTPLKKRRTRRRCGCRSFHHFPFLNEEKRKPSRHSCKHH
jgi:hypothetical protein